MAAGLDVTVPRQTVIAVYVVLDAVAVVILIGFAVEFPLVHPHVGNKVGMVVLNTHVHDGHHHARVTGTVHLPCLEQIDIRPLDGYHRTFGIEKRTVIVVMPLHRQSGVIERHFSGTALPSGLIRYRCRIKGIVTVGRIYPVDGTHIGHAGKRLESGLCP